MRAPIGSFIQTDRPSDFFGPPARRYIAGRQACFWQDGTRAFGTIAWGRPTHSDAALMTEVYEAVLEPWAVGHASITDIRALDAIDVRALESLVRFLVERRNGWKDAIGRQVLIHRGGVAGATVAGVMTLARTTYPMECFESDASAAFAWAGIADVQGEVEALHERLAGIPPVVRGVREVFQARGLLDIGELASALAMSPRTLQRRLCSAGTTLRAERHRHVVLAAESLLAGTDLDLDAIAHMVGLSSASHLVRMFVQAHGVSPARWRAQQKPAA